MIESAPRQGWLEELAWNSDGLVPAIAQDSASGDVLMMAWMNREALCKTLETGQAVYFSRSRRRLWHKGEESGHFQQVSSVRIDCDADVVLLQVEQVGNIACHTGRRRCFYRELRTDSGQTGPEWVVTDSILQDPDEIYSPT